MSQVRDTATFLRQFEGQNTLLTKDFRACSELTKYSFTTVPSFRCRLASRCALCNHLACGDYFLPHSYDNSTDSFFAAYTMVSLFFGSRGEQLMQFSFLFPTSINPPAILMRPFSILLLLSNFPSVVSRASPAARQLTLQ